MVPANGRRVSIEGHHCLLIDGCVSHGPPHLQGRSLDGILPAPGVKQPPLTAHPVVVQGGGAGGESYHIVTGPNATPPLRFRDRDAAALTQHYLDHGLDNYRWEERDPGPDDPEGSIVILKKGYDDSPPGSHRFSGDGIDHEHRRKKKHGVLAKFTKHPMHRDVAESGWRAILKGELHDRVVYVPYYPRADAVFMPAGHPASSPGAGGSAGTGTVGVGPSEGAQQAAAGVGSQSPSAGGAG